ncbi:hypothetical protein [Beduini massiliensis]|uniref:hypothetical protein n=1 Tax=Beduini massiliensis TaxID=1585974 RepID=UPI0012E0B3C3|nr:hypothetical protein [Beduini massiliensis]
MFKNIKKLACLMIALAICAGVSCQHIHDDNCGYNPETNNGCTHVSIMPLIEGEPPIG